ncbi:MAG: 4'-phosphopantetheinyl transferase superfamily protein [Candidatus Acidiferrales bacterium]
MRSSISWQPAPAPVALGHEEVHVWKASLEQPVAAVESLASSLSMDERERAARFKFERDRTNYIAGRGILRKLLGAYVGLPASRLEFDYAAREKPALRTEPEIHFNLAHTRRVALYAFARNREVGADLEQIQPALAADEIANAHFSPRELAAWRSMPDSVKAEEFFSYWTCKEAYAKATGLGLGMPLESFEVSLNESGAGRIVSGEVDTGWQVLTFLAAESHPAALVYRGAPCTICFFSYDAIAANTSGTLR